MQGQNWASPRVPASRGSALGAGLHGKVRGLESKLREVTRLGQALAQRNATLEAQQSHDRMAIESLKRQLADAGVGPGSPGSIIRSPARDARGNSPGGTAGEADASHVVRVHKEQLRLKAMEWRDRCVALRSQLRVSELERRRAADRAATLEERSRAQSGVAARETALAVRSARAEAQAAVARADAASREASRHAARAKDLEDRVRTMSSELIQTRAALDAAAARQGSGRRRRHRRQCRANRAGG